jgi:hypothetical protein
MRCVDVARELAVPTGAIQPAEIGAHLAACPTCASHAEQVHRLDRIWSATRPADPPAEVWDQLWARVMRAADGADHPATIPLNAAGRGRRWWAVAAVAQAAAVLIAVGIFLFGPVRQGASRTPIVVAQTFEFELEPGQTLFLELDEHGDRVVCKPRFEDTAELVAFDDTDPGEPLSLAWDMVVLNNMESSE